MPIMADQRRRDCISTWRGAGPDGPSVLLSLEDQRKLRAHRNNRNSTAKPTPTATPITRFLS